MIFKRCHVDGQNFSVDDPSGSKKKAREELKENPFIGDEVKD